MSKCRYWQDCVGYSRRKCFGKPRDRADCPYRRLFEGELNERSIRSIVDGSDMFAYLPDTAVYRGDKG